MKGNSFAIKSFTNQLSTDCKYCPLNLPHNTSQHWPGKHHLWGFHQADFNLEFCPPTKAQIYNTLIYFSGVFLEMLWNDQLNKANIHLILLSLAPTTATMRMTFPFEFENDGNSI